MNETSWSRQISIGRAVVAAILGGWLVASVLSVPLLVTNDGPQHAFAAYVANHLEDWDGQYTTNVALSSNGYHQVVTLAEPILGLQASHQIFVALVMLVWAGAWFWFGCRLRGPSSLLPLVAFPCAYQWIAYIGLYPFLLASACIPILLLLTGATLKPWPGASEHGSPSLGAFALISATLLLAAYLHAFAAMVGGGTTMLIMVLARRPFGDVIKLVAAGVPSAAYVLYFATRSQLLSTGSGTAFEFEPDILRLLFEDFLPGPKSHQMALAVLVLGAMPGVRRAVPAVGLLLVTVGVLFPVDLSGWELVKQRLLPSGFMLLVLGAPQALQLERACGVIVLLLAAHRSSWAMEFHQRTYDDYAAQMTAASAVRLAPDTHWVLLPLEAPMEPAMNVVVGGSGALHLTQALAPLVGGVPFFSHHSEPTVHHILRAHDRSPTWLGPVRKPAWVQPLGGDVRPTDRAVHLSAYLASMTWLDAIVVVGRPGDRETAEDVGFVVAGATETAGLSTFTLRPDLDACVWQGKLHGPPGQATVMVGFGADRAVRDTFVVDVGVDFTVSGLPCGPSWFAVDVGCAGEDANGFSYIRPRDQKVSCRVAAPE